MLKERTVATCTYIFLYMYLPHLVEFVAAGDQVGVVEGVEPSFPATWVASSEAGTSYEEEEEEEGHEGSLAPPLAPPLEHQEEDEGELRAVPGHCSVVNFS